MVVWQIVEAWQQLGTPVEMVKTAGCCHPPAKCGRPAAVPPSGWTIDAAKVGPIRKNCCLPDMGVSAPACKRLISLGRNLLKLTVSQSPVATATTGFYGSFGIVTKHCFENAKTSTNALVYAVSFTTSSRLRS